MVIWCTRNVRRDDSPPHVKVTQESSPYEYFTSTETVRTIRDEVYTPAVHSLFSVCTETGVLIYRSVCPLSVQCVHRDRCVHSKVCTPTLCSVCTVETGVLIHRSACPLFFSVCTKTYGCVNLHPHCPLYAQRWER